MNGLIKVRFDAWTFASCTRVRVMGSYPEIVAKPNICVTEMPSIAVAVLLRSGRDQPSSLGPVDIPP